MKGSMDPQLIDKKIFLILVISAVMFSGATFFTLDNKLQSYFVEKNVISDQNCTGESCYTVKATNKPTLISEQQSNTPSNSLTQTSIEDFTYLKVPTYVETETPMLLENKAILFAEKDSFIREGIPNKNTGSSETLRLMGTGPINNRVVVAFDSDQIGSILEDKTLKSATLKLFIQSIDEKWDYSQSIEIHRIQTGWTEGIDSGLFDTTNSNGITWNCPSQLNCEVPWNGGIFESQPTDSIFISSQLKDTGYWINFDVTDDVNTFVSGTQNNGWIIVKSNEDSLGRINFAARESHVNGPELVLVFSK